MQAASGELDQYGGCSGEGAAQAGSCPNHINFSFLTSIGRLTVAHHNSIAVRRSWRTLYSAAPAAFSPEKKVSLSDQRAASAPAMARPWRKDGVDGEFIPEGYPAPFQAQFDDFVQGISRTAKSSAMTEDTARRPSAM